MRKGDLVLGWGVAAASWGADRGVCDVSVNLWYDGKALRQLRDPGYRHRHLHGDCPDRQ